MTGATSPAPGSTHLAIGAQKTVVRWPGADGNPTETTLPIGAQNLGSGPFRRAPPTPLELEHAIEAVENVVMPLARVLPAGTGLHTRDAHARTLAGLAHPGPTAPAEMSIDDVERVFNQLVAVSEGRPAATSGLPTDPAFAAWVLILREFMHHLRFTALTFDAAA